MLKCIPEHFYPIALKQPRPKWVLLDIGEEVTSERRFMGSMLGGWF
jgi:hypothetical protein